MAIERFVYGRDKLVDRKRAVALGVFDGLHIGHRAVLSAVCGHLSPEQLTATGVSIVGVPKGDGGRLLTPEREIQLLETLGTDEWIELAFEEICDWSPERFVHEMLHDTLHAQLVACGYNFRFGKDGQGDTDTLRRLCEPLGITVIEVPSVERDGQPISSTRVRRAVAEGDMQTALQLLGRPFTVELPITSGDHRGRRWGTPTLNQVFPDGYAVPRYGVYASLVLIEDKQYRAVTNVGVHPTVGGLAKPQAETWIQDFDGELYGQTVSVQLIRFLRDEARFDTVEALTAQIAADAKAAMAALGGADGAKAVIFDFDDTLQDRTRAFLEVARWLLSRHMTEVDEAQREQYANEMRTANVGGYVDYSVFFHEFVERWPFDEGVTGDRILWEYRRLFPLCSQLFSETVEMLQELRERGYRLGIITNGSALMQNRKLDVTGLRPLLDVVLVSEDEGIHKPQAELFKRAAERLGVAPENCVFVGDHPINDIAGAKSAGMQVVYLNSRQLDEHPEGVAEITRLRDLRNVL